MQCPECGWDSNLDHAIFYGTFCPKCHTFIKAVEKPLFVRNRDKKLKILQEEGREHIRKQLIKLTEKKDADTTR